MGNLAARIKELEQLAAVTNKPETSRVFIDFSDVRDVVRGCHVGPETTYEEIIADIMANTTLTPKATVRFRS